MRSKARLVALLVVALPSSLATAEAPRQPTPMKVVIAHSTEPGCEPQCPEWISAQGAIDDTTPKQFKRVLATLGDRKLPVLVNSSGGRV